MAATPVSMVATPKFHENILEEAPKIDSQIVGATGTSIQMVMTPKNKKMVDNPRALSTQSEVALEAPPDQNQEKSLFDEKGTWTENYKNKEKSATIENKKRYEEEKHGEKSSLSTIGAHNKYSSSLVIGLEPMRKMITDFSPLVDYRTYRLRNRHWEPPTNNESRCII